MLLPIDLRGTDIVPTLGDSGTGTTDVCTLYLDIRKSRSLSGGLYRLPLDKSDRSPRSWKDGSEEGPSVPGSLRTECLKTLQSRPSGVGGNKVFTSLTSVFSLH